MKGCQRGTPADQLSVYSDVCHGLSHVVCSHKKFYTISLEKFCNEFLSES
jgi:hypothetical protein